MNFNKLFSLKRLPALLKGLFFVLRFDRFVPTQNSTFLSHLSALSKWIAAYKNQCPNDFYTPKFIYNKRENLFEQVIQENKLDTNIDYLEFGVSYGQSFSWWLNRIQDKNARFYGFDTFSGLPESWGRFKKGDMSNDNRPPVFDDQRCLFYQGLFQQTLLPFLSQYDNSQRKIIYMDADLYSATFYVLSTLTPYLKARDIIFFDEFNVPLHEFKAFKEWTESNHIGFSVLGGVNNFHQIAIMIK